jgi:sRNA-binding carbon storage regulator CsrA
MLVLGRKSGEKITIFAGGEVVELSVKLGEKRKSCEIAFNSTSGVRIVRNELLERSQQNAEHDAARGQAAD